jgi:hypothetical protein
MKLSKTMQGLMDKLAAADFYYMDETLKETGESRTVGYLHTADRVIQSGFASVSRITDGRFYTHADTKTIEALEKRGLIEIERIGGSSIDTIKVVGDFAPEPIKKALKVKVHTSQWSDYCGKQIEQDFIHHATPDGVDKIAEFFPGRAVAVEVIGEVELTVWDAR